MSEIINKIEELAKSLKLDVQNKTENSISIWMSHFTGIHLKIEVGKENELNFSFYSRTTSWYYSGERTDLHDIIPIIFAAFLKKLDLCTVFFFDIQNPATGVDDEIYSRYLLPIQIHPKLADINEESYKEKLEQLILSLSMFEQYFWNSFGGCPCTDCRKKLGYNYEYRWEEIGAKKINNLKKVFGESDLINYCERVLPTWFYYRDFKNKVTVVESPGLIHFMKALSNPSKNEKVKSNGGILLITETFSNYISSYTKRKIDNYFTELKDGKPQLLLLENKVIAVGDTYILTLDYLCGINKFRAEKEKLFQRHKHEFEVLFKPLELEWADNIDEGNFESLIKDLLEREPNVQRVRNVSHTNERDGGVDLIAEWIIPNTDGNDIQRSSYNSINVIIQCKAYKDGVAKSKVTDIRDTVEFRNYNGYFLAVSSYLKNSLSQHLDKIKTEGKIWIDWWGRDEINKRLIKNKDVLIKYSHIVKEKSK